MMRIGSLHLATNLALAPLAGYTNLPFRLVLRGLGSLGLATTDLVNARSLLERRDKAFKLIETHPSDTPLAVQLFGSVPEEMRDAAKLLETWGVAAVDINMGCPVRKVCQVGGGSAMLVDLKKTASLVKGMVEAVKIPVTAKMRLGWDADNITAPELAQALEDAGVSAITIHGRTREQGFGGTVNLAGIRAVVQAVRAIPVIGNGDITTPQAAKQMLDETDCAGLSIGRGAFYNPWIFNHIREYLATGGVPPEPSFEERIALMSRHLELMVEVFGESQGCRMFRKVAPWYARRFGPNKEFTRQVVRLSSRAEYDEIMAHYLEWRSQFLDENGCLKPNFQPGPLATSFSPLAAPVPKGLPTPGGPSEYW